MRKCISLFIVFSFLHINCAENESPSNEKIIEKISIKEDSIPENEINYLDSVPESIFQKILDIDFVRIRTAVLREHNIRFVFMANKSDSDSNEIHLQILAENEIRWIPIFNFHYQSENTKLFYLDTMEDSLILIK